MLPGSSPVVLIQVLLQFSGMLVCGVENIGEVMRLLEDASWEKYAAEEYNIEETQPAVLPDFYLKSFYHLSLKFRQNQ